MSPYLKQFILHFLKHRDLSPEAVSFHPLSGNGSKRVFWRITTSGKGPCFIAMINRPDDRTSRRENFAYLMIGNHLHQKAVPVPEIHRYDLEHGLFIMEDMGRTSLQELASSSTNPIPIYENVLENLFRLQIKGAMGFDTKWCCQTKRYDRTVMRCYEADYFRDAFLCRYLGLKKEWPELEIPFDHLANAASEADGNFFLHRDFQSRNIIISKGNTGIVDWQGGRLGPLGYDLASLLIDPYTVLSPQQRSKLYQSYLFLIKGHNVRWIESFKRYFPYLAIQRNLQILGAFSYLTTLKRKQYFENYIPQALRNLHELLHQANDPKLSCLKDLVDGLQCLGKSLEIPGSGE